MIEWDAAGIARGAGARLLCVGAGGPLRVRIDSRAVQPGDLFVGLPGERVDGGGYAAQALRMGAWGVLVAPRHAQATLAAVRARDGRETSERDPQPGQGTSARSPRPRDARALARGGPAAGTVLVHPDPLGGLQSFARAWRRRLGAEGGRVVAVTGSTGKTSTKDILAALLRGARTELGGGTVASPENLNTEIGLPLAVLSAPAGTRALVLEMAMRGPGQIAELAAIAEPDVGVIVNIGPVHIEQLGSLEAIAAAKAELIAGMAPGTTVVVPAGERLLGPHLRADLRTVTFGEGGDLELGQPPSRELQGAAGGVEIDARGAGVEVEVIDHRAGGERIVLRPSFAQSHNLRNLLAAVAAARALGVTPAGRVEVEFSALRGERIALSDGIVLINDCYNANPMSMRAALEDLAQSPGGRRVAVLGDMLELGAEERRLHRELGAQARASGVELLVAVGPLAAELGEGLDGEVHRVPDAPAAAALLPGLLRAGDIVLVKGSRGIGLERVAQALTGEAVEGGLAGVAGAPRSAVQAPGGAPSPGSAPAPPPPPEPRGER